jgi:hypothetical protein
MGNPASRAFFEASRATRPKSDVDFADFAEFQVFFTG